MKIIPGIRHLDAPFSRSCLTIGNFDGLHLGHRALIERVKVRAAEAQAPSVVMTFEPHPVKVLQPDRNLRRIFELEDQSQELQKMGVDVLVVEPFSREFSQLPPERFIADWIYRPFSPTTLVVGYDFSFGANRQGSLEFLKAKSDELGFQLEVMAPVKVDDILVSSSRIRQALQEGDVRLANRLLNRDFYVSGLVEKGAGRGRKIGVPTANLRTAAETLPKPGVYCALAEVHGGKFHAVVNIGYNPTFQLPDGQPALNIEAHLLDFDQDIYGEKLVLRFKDRLRDERKFSSVSELVAQIQLDIQNGRKILTAAKGN